MLTTDNYECTRELFQTIPSLTMPGKSVYEETMAFNELHPPHSQARLVDRNRFVVDVTSMGFTMQDRVELFKLVEADEAKLGAARITHWLFPEFFETKFWYIWATTRHGIAETVAVGAEDLVFFQNGSMTDASSYGSMISAPVALTKQDSGGWTLWKKLAAGRPEFGNPAVFNASIPESYWASFTVTLRDPRFLDQMEAFTGNHAGTSGLVTFQDSRWFMSIVLAHQPHFAGQPEEVQVFWGYALHPDRIGDFVAKSMSDCNGADILQEICGHLNFDRAIVSTATCSVRAAQMAVYELLHLSRQIPPIHRLDQSIKVQFDAAMKAFA